jgi:hypothetical protein
MTKPKTTECVVCGSVIDVKSGPGRMPKYCDACRKGHKAPGKRMCAHCGKLYGVGPKGRSWKSKYCSESCRRAANTDYAQRDCVICGKSLMGTHRLKFCSDKCKHEFHHPAPEPKRCDQCGKQFIPNKFVKDRQRFCCDECAVRFGIEHRKQRYEYVCQRCGKAYKTAYKDRNQYCSRECAYADIEAWHPWMEVRLKTCKCCGKEFKTTVASENYCSDKCQALGAAFTCDVCGRLSYGVTNQKYCSDECRADAARRRSYENAVADYDPDWITCPECGVEFKPFYGDKRRVYCSEDCSNKYNRRIGRGMRRARKHDNGPTEVIDPFDIFERDGWICYICGKSTPIELRGTTDDSAPEIDHVVPLSRGGPHTKLNVACCCRECNQSKADSLLSEIGDMPLQSLRDPIHQTARVA